MRKYRYILVNGEPVPEPDPRKWAIWFGTNERIVKRTLIGKVEISTVFIAIDHSFSDNEPPMLWGTMVFGGKLNYEQERYISLEDAKAGHNNMVERVRRSEE